MIFKRTIEDFVCEHCGFEVKGTGYTNHCPECLYSKHVDVEPGDRREACCGMMEPVKIEGGTPEYSILHKCTVCGAERRNKVSDKDSVDAITRIAKGQE
ncbi:RNHCP domain-containing protein [Candidatus Parcubacteria bacterium]|nr:MAG: RNHCP domain-containing protein [Candidatus Parcubacteria bacterium]